MALCPPCHAQTDAPYTCGRLVITPLAAGRFTVGVTRGADKWAIRVADQTTRPPAGRFENPQPIRAAETGETVAREERLLDPLDPIRPPAASLSEGQEHVDPRPVGQLRVHPLLVPRTRAHRVLAWLERCVLGELPLGGSVGVPHSTPLG